MCGGTAYGDQNRIDGRGLSPRVRGNPSPAIWARVTPGSIPACAGEPITPRSYGGSIEVYPRVCGGTATSHSPCGILSGLSPRVRGNRCPNKRPCDRCRSIPACAGEPHNYLWRIRQKQVYPRVCGGTFQPVLIGTLVEGLSPRVRGNQKYSCLMLDLGRSIPACAGEPGRCSR